MRNRETVGSFCLVKNEGRWIAGHLLLWLPHLDQMVLFDGNSKDGTLEIIKAIQKDSPHGHKIKLVEDRDPKDLRDDYVRLFDECLRSVDCNYAFFLHPDMIPACKPDMSNLRNGTSLAFTTKMRSFAGDSNLYEVRGRGERWKNIYRLRNPDMGAHYFGHYGAQNEDVYFRAITGDYHEHYGQDFQFYPYGIDDSGIEVLHFSDVRGHERRYQRMARSLENQGCSPEEASEIAKVHPRVTLKDGDGFEFVPAKYPADFISAKEAYAKYLKEPVTA